MVNDIFTPMNHREIEYNAKKLSGCDIPDAFACIEKDNLLKWLDETGSRLFDDDLIMDYGTDCLRLYLLFENTPKENDKYYDSWQEGALEGIYKFLGKYRRMVLAVEEWNSRGNYNDMISESSIAKIEKSLTDAEQKIVKCMKRGNDMPNRHNIVSALMEALKIIQKELKVSEIINSLHSHTIENAVPHKAGIEKKETLIEQIEQKESNSLKNNDVEQICRKFIILMTPFAPYLSKILWSQI